MREEDIRPAQLQEELKVLLKLDSERWLKEKDAFIRVNCPACNGNDTRDPISVRSYTFETCTACETVFYNPRPTAQQLQTYYSQAQSYTFWANKIFPRTEKARRDNIFRPLAERVVDYVNEAGIKPESLLEIGAGFGIFCDEISHRNLFDRVIAVEPTPDLAQKCRDKNLETIEKPIEKTDLGENSISCIASFEVIEHLYDPRDFLKKCWSLLKTEGLLILTCPNVKGFDFTVLGLDKAPNFGLEHINMFHPESLKLLVEAEGFEVIDLCTPGKLDADIVRNQALQGAFDLDPHPFLKRVLVDEWDVLGGPFQDFLANNMLSSNMLLVAKKRSVAAGGE